MPIIQRYKITSLVLLFIFVFAFSNFAKAEIIFEGYYKVTQFKKHIGFLILRQELDAKSKNFITTSFTKLAKNGFDMTETYQATSDANLNPVSLHYLAADGKKTAKTIDAEFKKGKMIGTAVENGKKTKLNTAVPEGVFLSSALYYLMLRSKEGLKTDSKFDFSAITEEGPVIMTGTAAVDKKLVTQGSLQLLKIKNSFAGSDYENLVTNRGEVVSAVTNATSIETVLVKSSDEALEGIKLTAGTLEKIFGDVPTGKINVYQPKK